MSDFKRPSDKGGFFSGATDKTQSAFDRLNRLLQETNRAEVVEGQENALPYREIFQQNYHLIPKEVREKMRTAEQVTIIEVPVADLPDPEEVAGPQDFNHHITYEDARLHTQQLNDVVLPWVRSGAVGDDFKALDQALGSEDQNELNRNGYAETYRLFYGPDSISMGHAADGLLDITGGRHRIYMAKELGLISLPVRQTRTSL